MDISDEVLEDHHHLDEYASDYFCNWPSTASHWSFSVHRRSSARRSVHRKRVQSLPCVLSFSLIFFLDCRIKTSRLRLRESGSSRVQPRYSGINSFFCISNVLVDSKSGGNVIFVPGVRSSESDRLVFPTQFSPPGSLGLLDDNVSKDVIDRLEVQ